MCYKVSQAQPVVTYKEYYKAIDILTPEESIAQIKYFNANGFSHPN